MDRTFLKSDIFLVEEVHLEGDVAIVAKELEKEAELLRGELIWDIDTEEIKSILEEDVRVAEAVVEKEIPNKLTIRIRGKRPQYYVLYEGQIYSLDGEKKPFSFLDEFSMKDFPILSVKNMDEIEELIKILERTKGKQLEKLISQLYIEDENCIKIVLLDGTILKTRPDVLEEKYNLAERLYLKLKADGESLEYIDIRFADYIVK